ncbi:MAG: hypothetical protein G01um101429_634 [Parcubacteria group bacterium Gr01-1014_29]|nr:MAG: hypothetical protein G01um101429_634 [Parcubacteria group bacterium Gr01-1014_29]
MKILALALVVQGFHWIEHLAQVYQHWWLGLPIKESKGILFFLDLEWNHFVFNSAYFVLLVVVWFLLRNVSSRVAMRLLIVGTLIQGYHLIEHAVRIWQHIQTACEPCKGILGWYIDGVYLHFAFNTLVLLLPLIAFIFLIRPLLKIRYNK